MNRIFFIIAAALTATIAIGGITYSGGPGGGGMGGGGMGGGGNGMMGGGHMRGSGQGYSLPFQDLYNRYNRSDQPNSYGPRETERLRQEIREKRKELKVLYSSVKPDEDLIDKKIDELSELEAELDYRLSGTEYQRR
jgi:Spy/CpxP family protein refolding chaperone